MKNKLLSILIILFLIFLALHSANLAFASQAQWGMAGPSSSSSSLEENNPQQSTTGPTPPAEILERDRQNSQINREYSVNETVLSVPAYLWRHGCGPTALGMVIGFYDSHGYEVLVSGDASSQTASVDQMIASGGEQGLPNPPGMEGNFEDYASPVDSYPTMLEDAYLTADRTPHPSDSLADFMDTSKSTHNNYYGWSWSNDMGPAFLDYVSLQNPAYQPSFQAYWTSNGTMTESVLINEINANRPMVFLVDSDGNGGTDHFITIIGYRYAPNLQYAAWDTWYDDTIRWEEFRGIQAGVPWGIWGGWSFNIESLIPSAPTNVSATDGLIRDRIYISWHAVSAADYYEVYRCTDDSTLSCGTLLDTSSTESFDDFTATPDTVFYYRIISCSSTFGCSDFSTYDTGYYDSDYQGWESFAPLALH